MRAYARSRRERSLPGGTHNAVRKAITTGRLVRSVERAGRAYSIDPVVADQEWEENADPVKQTVEPQERAAPAPRGAQPTLFGGEPEQPQVREPPRASIKTSQAVRLAYQARLAQLEYEQRSGKLCPVEQVKLQAARCAATVKVGLANIPNRLAPLLAAESDEEAVRRLVEIEVDNVLGEMVEAMRAWPAQG